MNEHRESTILAASTNHQQRQQRKAGVTVVTVDPDNEDEEPDGINGVNEAAQVHRAAVPEKLTDEDKFAEIWYERWFFKIFPQLKRGTWLCGWGSMFHHRSYRTPFTTSLEASLN